MLSVQRQSQAVLRSAGVCCIVACVFSLSFDNRAGFAETAAQQPVIDAERLSKRDRLWREAKRLEEEGKVAEAVAAGRSALAIERELFGVNHEQTVTSIGWIARQFEVMEDFGAAHKSRQDALAIATRLWGDDSWRVTDARLALEHVTRLENLTQEQRRELVHAGRLNASVVNLFRERNYGEALVLAEQVREIRQRILGDDHREYALSLQNVGAQLTGMGEYVRAETYYRQAMEIRRRVLGEGHPEYAFSLTQLATCLNEVGLQYTSRGEYERAERRYQEAMAIRKDVLGEEHRDYSQSLTNLAALYGRMGMYQRAEPLYRRSLQIKRQVIGEEDPSYATCLNNLGVLYLQLNDFERAEDCLLQSIRLRKRLLGETHPHYLTSLNNLASVYKSRGDFSRAEPLFQTALDVAGESSTANWQTRATCLHNLAGLYKSMGDYAQAETCYLEALGIEKENRGDGTRDYATSLGNLGRLYQLMGDFTRALAKHRDALTILERTSGRNHRDYAVALHDLASLYQTMGDYVRAEPLYRQALEIKRATANSERYLSYAVTLNDLATLYVEKGDTEQALRLSREATRICRQVLGDEHQDYAQSLNNVGTMYLKLKDFTEAERHLRKALDIYERILGTDHPKYAAALNNLAELHRMQGNYGQAGALYETAKSIQETALGDMHPDYGTSLFNIGLLHQMKGEYEQAERPMRKSLRIGYRALELAAEVQSDRQQFAMLAKERCALDAYVTIACYGGSDGEAAYRQVLTWKGIIHMRQRLLRAAALEPELFSIFDELRSTTSRLATLALAAPDPKLRDVWQRQVKELSEQKEALEAELSERNRAYREAKERTTLEQLQDALPPGAILVDFVEYFDYGGKILQGEKPNEERRILAFVVGRESVIGPIPLVSAKELDQQVDLWRDGYGVTSESAAAGRWLRNEVWNRVARHLADAKVVLVSPDGALARLPLGALPGKETGTYLLEEVPLAIVAAPQLLPELLADNESASAEIGSFLLLGGVDYDAPLDRRPSSAVKLVGLQHTAVRAWDASESFAPLPRTRDEIERIGEVCTSRFPNAHTQFLRGSQATEDRFRELAPRQRYLHLATHGYFSPPSLHSALTSRRDTRDDRSAFEPDFAVTGYHPGLLSGLALAGANGTAEPDQADGILTAEEVATMNLPSVDLAVLSACETGLGKTGGGEGVLGLQRAFHVAGARTVVSSLWKVDDEVTHHLMTRFYDNLLRKRMGKLEALRDAQLTILNADAVDLGSRSLLRESQPLPDRGTVTRTHPRLWAAWVLSGDPGNVSFALESPNEPGTVVTGTEPISSLKGNASQEAGEWKIPVWANLTALAAALVVVIIVSSTTLLWIQRKNRG